MGAVHAPRHVRLLVIAGSLAVAASCGDALPSRQDFVDRLSAQSEGFITEDVGSCMYDRVADDDEASDAVAGWEPGDDLPEVLFDIATDCLTAEDAGAADGG